MTTNTPAKPTDRHYIWKSKPQRKQLILNFINEYRRVKHGMSPTYLEIARGIGYTATMEGTAHTYVQELIEEGWLERLGGSRSLIPLRPPTDIYAEITDDELKTVAHRQKGLRILRRL